MTDPQVPPRELGIPEKALVVLVGVSGSGKSTFARRHFGQFEVISSDFCRGLVADDENDQAASGDAFDVLHFIAGKRLAAGRLTVVDATNVQAEVRKRFVELARSHDLLPVAIVLDVPRDVCAARNTTRPERNFGAHVVRRQHDQLRRSMRWLGKEGFRKVHVLHGVPEVDSAVIVRERLLTDYRDRTGSGSAALATSARWHCGSTRSASKGWKGLHRRIRSGVCMKRFSLCSRSNRSR